MGEKDKKSGVQEVVRFGTRIGGSWAHGASPVQQEEQRGPCVCSPPPSQDHMDRFCMICGGRRQQVSSTTQAPSIVDLPKVIVEGGQDQGSPPTSVVLASSLPPWPSPPQGTGGMSASVVAAATPSPGTMGKVEATVSVPGGQVFVAYRPDDKPPPTAERAERVDPPPSTNLRLPTVMDLGQQDGVKGAVVAMIVLLIVLVLCGLVAVGYFQNY